MSDAYEEYEKANALREQAELSACAGRLDEARKLLEMMDSLPVVDDVEWERPAAWNQLAKLLFHADRQADASAAWEKAISYAQAGEGSESLQYSLDASSTRWEIAETLALAGEWQRAEQLAEGIKSAVKRNHALSALDQIRLGGPGSQFSGQWTKQSE